MYNKHGRFFWKNPYLMFLVAQNCIKNNIEIYICLLLQKVITIFDIKIVDYQRGTKNRHKFLK